jgi:hypothetical protein
MDMRFSGGKNDVFAIVAGYLERRPKCRIRLRTEDKFAAKGYAAGDAYG